MNDELHGLLEKLWEDIDVQIHPGHWLGVGESETDRLARIRLIAEAVYKAIPFVALPDADGWVAVVSSNIDAVRYDGVTLGVRFTSGAVYEYTNVPQQEYTNLINAGSKGSYFSKNIRKNYEYTKVGDQ